MAEKGHGDRTTGHAGAHWQRAAPSELKFVGLPERSMFSQQFADHVKGNDAWQSQKQQTWVVFRAAFES